MTQASFTEKRAALRFGKEPLLSHLDIELTERCNNACLHCYINLPADYSEARKREFDTDQWKGIIAQAAELGALSVRFTGGEPLLREDFPELYLFARQLGLKVVLFTNARGITPEIARLLARTPALGKIEVTVYGMRASTYDMVACSPGAYTEFRRGIQLLLDYSVPFIVKGALLPQNRVDMQELDDWAVSIPWMENPPVYSLLFDLRCRHDSAARDRTIRGLRLPTDECVAILDHRVPGYRAACEQVLKSSSGPAGTSLFTCRAGKGGCVDASGQYQPCMLLRDPSVTYDLKTGSLRDALLNFFPRLKDIRATNPLYLQRCARCFLHGLCDQCPAKSWMEHGALDIPVEYYCQIAHAKARYLGLLLEGEQAWEVEDWRQRLNPI